MRPALLTLFVLLFLTISSGCSSPPRQHHPKARTGVQTPMRPATPGTKPLDAQARAVDLAAPARPDAGKAASVADLDKGCVASWKRTIDELVADKTSLYWASGNKVVAWPKAGGAPRVLADLQADPHDLVTDDKTVYWLAHEAVRAVNKTGGKVRTLAQPPEHKRSYFSGLVIWSRSLYLTAPINRHVWSVRCDGRHGLSVAARAPGCNRLATDGRALYAGCKQGLLKLYRNIVVPKQLVSTKSAVTNLAVDRRHLFWTEQERGRLLRTRKGGGKPEVLARTQGRIVSLALDARHVYFTAFAVDNDGDGAVLRVAKRGGKVKVLASGQSRPDNVVVDPDHVYWSTQIGKRGCVVRRAKMPR